MYVCFREMPAVALVTFGAPIVANIWMTTDLKLPFSSVFFIQCADFQPFHSFFIQ